MTAPLEHPNAFRLEAWHAGEHDPQVQAHVADCSKCQHYVEQLVRGREALLGRRPTDAFVQALLRSTTVGTRPRRSLWRWRWAVPLTAACAAVFFFVRVEPEEVRLKGPDVSLALVVERGGRQDRHTGAVRLQPGDRVRVELGLARAMRVTVAVVQQESARPLPSPQAGRDIGSVGANGWTVLASAKQWAAGRHYVGHSLRIDSQPTRAWVVAGSAKAVADAMRSGSLERLVRVRIESGGGPR